MINFQFPNTFWFEPNPGTGLITQNTTFQFPFGVTKAFISCAPASGGGGGGSGVYHVHVNGDFFSHGKDYYYNGIGGGGGGTKPVIYRVPIIVDYNQIYNIVVGKGGAGGFAGGGNEGGTAGGNGETTYFKLGSTVLFSHAGGIGGQPGSPSVTSAAGGADGGQASVKIYGGNGSFVNSNYYGGNGGKGGVHSTGDAATKGAPGSNARILIEWFKNDTPTGIPILFPENGIAID